MLDLLEIKEQAKLCSSLGLYQQVAVERDAALPVYNSDEHRRLWAVAEVLHSVGST